MLVIQNPALSGLVWGSRFCDVWGFRLGVPA